MMRRATRTYDPGELRSKIEALGYSCKKSGSELAVDFDHSGHHSYKLNPAKGCWIGNGRFGESGTIASLLYEVDGGRGHRVFFPPVKPATESKPKHDTSVAAIRIWNAAKRAREGYRDDLMAPFTAYCEARCLDARHLLDSDLVRLTRPSQKFDSDQIKAGAVVMAIMPMTRNGATVGIQRLYLTKEGRKVNGFYQDLLDPESFVDVLSRKMLGRSSHLRITPPSCSNPIPLPGVSGPACFFGEGLETTMSAVMVAGLPGIACYSASGVTAWAEQQAADAKFISDEQRAALPTFIGLVDRDASETGQKATAKAVFILREAGLKAFYAEPPSANRKASFPVMNAGPKGCDWNDALIQFGLDGTAAALEEAVSHSDEWMPKVSIKPEENRSPAEVFFQRPWKKAATEIVRHFVDPVSPKEGRKILSKGIDRLVGSYVRWLQLLAVKKKGARNPEFAPALFHVTTGAGKSTLLRALNKNEAILDEGGACLVLVPDHAQADSYASAGWFHYYGRNPDPESPAYCPNYDEMMQAVSHGHVPQNSFCHKCPNGLKWAIGYYGLDSEKGRDALSKLHRMGKTDADIQKIVPCRWQNHLREAQWARFVVAPATSFSETLATWLKIVGKEVVDVHRLVLVDEGVNLSKGTEIGMQDLDTWAKRNADQIRGLQKAYDDIIPSTEEAKEKKDDIKEQLDALFLAEKLFPALAQNLARFVGKSGQMKIGDELLEYCRQIVSLNKSETAPWEKIEFKRDGHLEIAPLRAAFAIAQTLGKGGGFVDNGRINVAAINPILNRIGKRPIAFFNATPEKNIEQGILDRDGSITRSVILQKLHTIRHPQRHWGLSPFRKDADAGHRARTVGKYRALRSLYPESAMLVHKKPHDALDPKSEDRLMGHWGADHRAHDAWSGRDLVICGSFFPPQKEWRKLYEADRLAALMMGVDEELWPSWPDDFATEKGAWVDE
ncbi:hypothetical protein HFU97_00995, partial [Acidithiobacillus sp. BN09-2]|nr:hypothetical protein [Acidithiobacillus sp. BN09-2]